MTTTTGRFLVGPAATIVMLLIVSMTGGVAADEPEGRQAPSGFSDVPAGHVFAQEVAWLASTGITQGRGDGSFGVADPVTRGAMAAFLYRYDGEPDGSFGAPGFLDVPAGHVFEQEVAWLASTGITQGRGDGSFGIGDAVTRGAMAAFLYRYNQYLTEAADPQPEPTPDPEPQPPATDAQQWRRVAHDETVFGGDDRQWMSSVAVGGPGPGLVAVGDDFVRDAAAVWTSTDGAVWQRVAHDESVFGGDRQQSMPSVTTGGPGLVAVGRDRGRDAAAVWISS